MSRHDGLVAVLEGVFYAIDGLRDYSRTLSHDEVCGANCACYETGFADGYAAAVDAVGEWYQPDEDGRD